MELDETRKACEAWIRSGQAALARKALQKLDFAKIPRSQLPVFCALARRSNYWPASLRALKPIVRPKTKTSKPPTAAEKIEYALSLRRAGAFDEADRLLGESDLAAEPKAILARGFGYIHQWDYANALPCLDLFILQKNISEYDLLTAHVNRLACLNYLAHPDFEKLFTELEPALGGQGHFLLLANSLETYAQYLIERERWSEAGQILLKAKKLIEDEGGRHLGFVNKWQRILHALKNKSVQEIETYREDAFKSAQWETVRDLDYQQTKLQPDCRWSNPVYFGTPFQSFRKRLEKLRPYPEQEWLGEDETNRFDPWFPGDGEGGLPHRLLVFLLRDLYRPVSIGQIFSALHANEYFDVDSSATRVRQLMKRARQWVAKNKMPLSIDTLDGLFALRIQSGAQVLFRRELLEFDDLKFFFGRYRHRSEIPHTAVEWAKEMKSDPATATRILKRAVDSGTVRKKGSGRYTHYLLA